jgi:excisionase family DNA binding protein
MKLRDVYTTGEIAKLCNVAARTVSKWTDDGKLKCYRIPGSNDRRVTRESLIRFLKANGMPMGDLEEQQVHRVLLIGCDPCLEGQLREGLPEGQDYVVSSVISLFEAGMIVASERPAAVVVSMGIGASEGCRVAETLKQVVPLPLLVALTGEDHLNPEELLTRGFGLALPLPLNVARLTAAIVEAAKKRWEWVTVETHRIKKGRKAANGKVDHG